MTHNETELTSDTLDEFRLKLNESYYFVAQDLIKKKKRIPEQKRCYHCERARDARHDIRSRN